MPTKDLNRLTSTALALPRHQRAKLAQALWNSIEEVVDDSLVEKSVMAEIKKRDREITEGKVRCKTHKQVMKAAYKALGCSR